MSQEQNLQTWILESKYIFDNLTLILEFWYPWEWRTEFENVGNQVVKAAEFIFDIV